MSSNKIIVHAVTMARIVGALLVIALAFKGWWLAVTAVAILAFATDFADGWLARRWQATSSFGAFFDPLADKIVCEVLMILLAWHYNLPLFWILTVIFVIYDISTTLLRLKRTSKGALKTSQIAKYKTALLMTGLVVLSLAVIGNMVLFYIGSILWVLAAILSVYSLAHYVRKR